MTLNKEADDFPRVFTAMFCCHPQSKVPIKAMIEYKKMAHK